MRHKPCLGRIGGLQRPKGCGKNTRDHGDEHHDRHGTAKTWSHGITLSDALYPDHVSNANSEHGSGATEINSDSTAILPVRIGTGIALIALLYCAITQPISPNEVSEVSEVSEGTGGIWWFGVALIASISGVIGLFFLQWRKNRMLRRSR